MGTPAAGDTATMGTRAAGDTATMGAPAAGDTATMGTPASGETATAATATVKTAATAATSTAAATTATATAAGPGQEQQWCIFCTRRRGGDIAGHAAAPGDRGGRRWCGHQSDQRGRRHVKQTLSHRCGLHWVDLA
jgi:hypothetical protein